MIKFLFVFLVFFPIISFAEEMDIQSDTLEIYQDKGYAVFTGNVVSKQSGMVLSAQKLEVFFTPKTNDNDATDDINKIVAEEKVIIKYKKDVATGDKATYNPISNTIVLTGKVVFIHDENVLKGEKLVYNIKTGKTKLTSNTDRIKVRLVPETNK